MAGRRRSKEELNAAAQRGLALAVERLRRRKGWTRERLAKEANLTPKTISSIEHCEWEPKWGTLSQVAKALGLSMRRLHELAIDAAPGVPGDMLRTQEEKAEDVDVNAVIAKRSAGRR